MECKNLVKSKAQSEAMQIMPKRWRNYKAIDLADVTKKKKKMKIFFKTSGLCAMLTKEVEGSQRWRSSYWRLKKSENINQGLREFKKKKKKKKNDKLPSPSQKQYPRKRLLRPERASLA